MSKHGLKRAYTVLLSEHKAQVLEAMAHGSGMSPTQVVRCVVEDYLMKHRPQEFEEARVLDEQARVEGNYRRTAHRRTKPSRLL